MDLRVFDLVFAAFAFVLGACIGSFLNVCIYRLPRDLSINQPRRSFCPACKAEIPWTQNLPLVSWIALRGRCKNCGGKISARYFVVELLTGLMFLAAWLVFPAPMAIAYWVFISLVIAATFIDIEHFIIPDEITIGGTILGIIASFIVPELMGADHRAVAFLTSTCSALFGFGLLWLVLEGGKLAFGKKRVRLDKPTAFSWKREGDDARFTVGDETSLWSEFFAREKDVMLMHCEQAKIDNLWYEDTVLRFHYNRVSVDDRDFLLDEVTEITGTVRELQIPREAMGRGDLKFLAAIGAFLGWKGVLFSVFAGSLVGSFFGLATLIFGKRVWSAKLPFGPYLSLGALIWLFFGEALVRWYVTLLYPS